MVDQQQRWEGNSLRGHSRARFWAAGNGDRSALDAFGPVRIELAATPTACLAVRCCWVAALLGLPSPEQPLVQRFAVTVIKSLNC
jgi:hypothetical protein